MILAKIIFDHQSFSRQAHGGVSRSFLELARALNQLDSSTAEIFAPVHWNEYLAEQKNSSFVFGWRQTRGIFRLWNARWWLNHWMTTAKCRVSPPDILHETWYSEFGYRTTKRTRIATTVHDLIYQLHPDWTGDSASRSHQLRTSLKRADIVLCVSEFTRNDLLNWQSSLDPSRVFVVHHGVTPLGVQRKFEDGSLPSETTIHCPFTLPSLPYLLFVGQRASRNKNFGAFAQAFASSGLQSDFGLVCFGGGPFTTDENQLFRALGFRADRVFQQSGDDNALKQAYVSAAALAYPSRHEGFGMPLLEAMLYHCPVASSNATCLPEIGGDACLYFDPEDTTHMAHVLREVLEDSCLRSKLIARGHERAKHFSWKAAAEKTLAAYSSAV